MAKRKKRKDLNNVDIKFQGKRGTQSLSKN